MLKHLALLQNMPIFGGISAGALEFLLESSEYIQRMNGEFFFEENQLADSMYVIESGRVAIFRKWKNKQIKLRELGKGDCFGEMALMDCKPRSASVQALEMSRVIQITSQQFNDLYEAFPEQFTLIQMNMGREVCRRLREADNRLFVQTLEYRQLSDTGAA